MKRQREPTCAMKRTDMAALALPLAPSGCPPPPVLPPL
jgi:hypothetical protein